MAKTTERRVWWRFPSGTVYYGTAGACPGGSISTDPPGTAEGAEGVRVGDPVPSAPPADDQEDDG